jgi:hypothetical protein
MSLGVMMHGPYALGDGLATSGHDGSKPQHEEPVIRWGGKNRLKCMQYWHSTIWDLYTLSLSWLRLAVSPIVEYYCTMKSRLSPPQKGQKSS